jgi:hypothetical protein
MVIGIGVPGVAVAGIAVYLWRTGKRRTRALAET